MERTVLVAVVVAGAVGGLVGGAYLGVLALVSRMLGPKSWAPAAHLVVLVSVGGLVAVGGRWLGERVSMELLVDHIHVRGGPEGMAGLRSLVPTSLVCIGVGGALGPEAPLVTTTGTLGSWIGGRSGFERDQLRIVSIAGMAAGFTVLFGAPLGSAVFALEILHRRSLRYEEALLPAAVGALCGYAAHAATTGLGLRPVFAFPATGPFRLVDLAWGVVAGLVGAALATAFRLLSRGLERLAGALPRGGRPVVGGALLGLLALASPYALTNGEVQIEHLTTVRLGAAVLLGAAAVKLVASAVTLVAGWEGGFIIPLFFVGFCVARAAADLVPGLDPWMAAAALMAATNAGVTRTPIGSTLVVAEMAGMALLPSTLAAAVISTALTARRPT